LVQIALHANEVLKDDGIAAVAAAQQPECGKVWLVKMKAPEE